MSKNFIKQMQETRKEKQAARFKEMETRMKKTRLNLYLERTRGVLIDWLNEFRYLKQFSEQTPTTQEDKESISLCLAKSFERCLSNISSSHCGIIDHQLSASVEVMEKKVCDRVCTIAYQISGRAVGVEDALAIIVQHNQLNRILRCVDCLIGSIEKQIVHP